MKVAIPVDTSSSHGIRGTGQQALTIGIPRAEWGNQAQWAATAPLLAAALLGSTGALYAVIGFCALTTLYYGIVLRSISAYRLQVRIGFMALVALGLLPELRPILVVPLLGTTAQVLFGYCPMARILNLMPWNRTESLTWQAVRSIILRPPGNEGILSNR
jgi:hypothetical protein